MTKSNPLEKEIQNKILDYLREHEVFCWRNNSVGIFDPYRGTFRRQGKYEVLGVSDIIGIFNGYFLAIEVKRKGGKLTENQQIFLEEINLRGGLSAVVYSFEDFVEWWEVSVSAWLEHQDTIHFGNGIVKEILKKK